MAFIRQCLELARSCVDDRGKGSFASGASIWELPVSLLSDKSVVLPTSHAAHATRRETGLCIVIGSKIEWWMEGGMRAVFPALGLADRDHHLLAVEGF